MTYPSFCRLCLNMGLDFKSLYDEENQFTEVYELVTKYFDQSILNMDDAKHLTKVCLQCWEHIWDFNNFQKAIEVAQSNLDAVKHLEIVTERENSEENVTQDECQEQPLGPVTDNNKEDCICLSESDDEGEVSIVNQPNALPLVEPVKSNETLENVDLTFDDDDEGIIRSNTPAIENPNDSLGVYIEGEITNRTEIANNVEYELIDLESDSSPSLVENGNSQTTEDESSYRPIIQDNDVSPDFSRHFMPITPLQYFKCALCPRKYNQYTKLLEHFNSVHPSRIAQVFCCNLRFTGLSAISDHLVQYHEMMRLSCRICGKKYVKIYYLQRHMESHHPEANLIELG